MKKVFTMFDYRSRKSVKDITPEKAMERVLFSSTAKKSNRFKGVNIENFIIKEVSDLTPTDIKRSLYYVNDEIVGAQRVLADVYYNLDSGGSGKLEKSCYIVDII